MGTKNCCCPPRDETAEIAPRQDPFENRNLASGANPMVGGNLAKGMGKSPTDREIEEDKTADNTPNNKFEGQSSSSNTSEAATSPEPAELESIDGMDDYTNFEYLVDPDEIVEEF